MTTAQQAAKELIRRRQSRSNLMDFTRYTKPDYETNWHHKLIAGKLDRWVKGEIRRLMLFTPPRHGKSELASRRLPAMIFGLRPSSHVISCSYSSGLAERMNRDVQRVMDSSEYLRLFPDSRLPSKGQPGGFIRNSEQFEIVKHGGSYRCAGIGGGITGMGFDYGIIDDPIKDPEEASSPTIRQNVWDWYTGAFWTRQAPNAKILLIMTRWNVDDLAGRLLKLAEEDSTADKWEVVNLEAVATESGRATTLVEDGRKPGEALWPQRYGLDYLNAARSTLGSAMFEAMFQGRPTQEGGNNFKEHWLNPLPAWEFYRDGRGEGQYRIYRKNGSVENFGEEQCSRFVIVDPAASEKQSADYTAIGSFARTPLNDLLVLGMVRERLGVERIVPRTLEVAREHRASWIGVEASGFQVSLVNAARRTPGMPAVRELSHKGKGKLVRATPAIIKAEAGQLILPKVADWKRGLIAEMISFTGDGDRHDDQVDVVAYAVLSMGGGFGGAVAVK